VNYLVCLQLHIFQLMKMLRGSNLLTKIGEKIKVSVIFESEEIKCGMLRMSSCLNWSLNYLIIIVMIDSITKLCLSLLVCTNGLSYSGEETQPTLCIKATPNQPGVRDDKRNKHQLLHRIQSVRTFTNLQYYG